MKQTYEDYEDIYVRQTYWYIGLLRSNFLNSIYYDLFMAYDSPIYYNKCLLSSRYIYHDEYDGDAKFGLRVISGGKVTGEELYSSNDGIIEGEGYPIRPIVTLGTNISINLTDTSKDGSTEENAYQINW